MGHRQIDMSEVPEFELYPGYTLDLKKPDKPIDQKTLAIAAINLYSHTELASMIPSWMWEIVKSPFTLQKHSKLHWKTEEFGNAVRCKICGFKVRTNLPAHLEGSHHRRAKEKKKFSRV